MAFPTGYSKYDLYEVTSGDISSGPHTDFPIYVDLSDLSSTFWATVRTDGGDIRVTVGDGDSATELPVEVVVIDTVGETGEMWFKASTLSTSARTFSIWYNGTDTMPAEDATYGSENVWPSDVHTVAHLEEDPSGTAPQMRDSTSNDHDGTSVGSMNSGDSVAGALAGNGLQFDGTDDYIDFGTNATMRPANEMTWSFWSRLDGTSESFGRLIQFGSGNVEPQVLQGTHLSNELCFDMTTTGGTDPPTIYDSIAIPSSWTLFHAVYDGSDVYIYRNGVEVATASGTGTIVYDDTTNGLRLNNTSNFAGSVDEMHLWSVGLSAGWCLTEYNNQGDHAGWSTVTAKSRVPWYHYEQERVAS